MEHNEKLLEVRNLKKYFPIKKGLFKKTTGYVYAVDDISFDLHKGRTLGLVGESGCGKSTTGRAILQLQPPTAGEVLYEGENLAVLSQKQMRPNRRKMQIIFQDPYASLNPRLTVEEIVSEPIIVHKLLPKDQIEDRVAELLGLVGLDSELMNRYPHEFSGGQRQRVSIARALALNPDLIVCDEPISALDVSIQAQVLNLLIRLQKELDLTYLFIAHDLSMVHYVSDDMAVMYLGTIVEKGTSEQLYKDPMHPYTRALLSAEPKANPRLEKERHRIILKGELPSPINPPSGCRFRTRCPQAMDICKEIRPELQSIGDERMVACHLFNGSKEN